MNKIEYGTEFLDQLKDKVHEQQWEIEELKQKLEDIRYKVIKKAKEYIEKCLEDNYSIDYEEVLEILEDDING